MSGVVTPEAVHLEFEAAGIGSRAIALVLDLLLQATVVMLLLFGLGLVVEGAGAGVPDWVGVTVTLLLVFAVLWGYPVTLETLWRGQTLGKAAMGLRVVTREGAPVRFRHAAVRAALGIVDFYLAFGGIAVVSALVTREHQRLGDLVAGTLVLRERTGTRAATAVQFRVPPGAESYAATIDPAGLTTQDYAAVRGYLLRAGDLAPAVRADLAARLAHPIAARLGHQPPDGVSAEVFLACAAARYQHRGDAGGRRVPAWSADRAGSESTGVPAGRVPPPPPSAPASAPAPPPSTPPPPPDSPDEFAPPG